MIDRTHRFQGRGSLTFVYKRGQSIRGKLLALRYILNTRTKNYRVAVVVSRKVHKSAVVRNRIRRRVYETLRDLAPHITGTYDLVFVVYNEELATVSTAELQRIIHGQLQEAGVLDGSPTGAKRGIVKPIGDKTNNV